ncbi:MAG: hydroxymethylbilane synthase [Acidimicrobiales bacterium]|jgi:hydroxymethylbilane synthase
MSDLRLATRRSPLALRQAEFVRDRLRAHGIESVFVELDTGGDAQPDAAIASIGGQGIFAVEIQRAVLRGEADVAVHSAKDLPSETPEGLAIVSVPERRDPADVLVGRSLAGLGPGATVATGSPRRRALLLERRPDLRIVELRGNMARRLASAGQGGIDAVVAASAALDRLGENGRIAERLDPAWFVPQVGQGAIALEARADDSDTAAVLAKICDADAMEALRCERAFLSELGAGCTVPAGAYATLRAGLISVIGVMLSSDGSSSVRATLEGADPTSLGRDLAVRLRDGEGGANLAGWDDGEG